MEVAGVGEGEFGVGLQAAADTLGQIGPEGGDRLRARAGVQGTLAESRVEERDAGVGGLDVDDLDGPTTEAGQEEGGAVGVGRLAEHGSDGLDECLIGMVGFGDPLEADAHRKPTFCHRIEEAGSNEVLYEPVGRCLREIGVGTDIGDRRLALLADDLQDQRQAFEMHETSLSSPGVRVPSCGNCSLRIR